MIWSHLFGIGKLNLLIKIQGFWGDSARTTGYSARVVPTCQFVTFLDYDNIGAEYRLKEELVDLQELFEIGNFYVLSTSELARHCACIDALRFRDVKEIVDFSTCDLMFKDAPRRNEYRTWIFRHEWKGDREPPKYVYTVESPYEGKNPQSRGHAVFLRAMFGVPVPELKYPVGEEAIEVQRYNTWSKVSKADLEKSIKHERGDRNG